MAADRTRGDQPRRTFVTRTHVEDAKASGRTLRVGPRDVVTDEAAQRAADLGVRIEREAAASTTATRAPAPAPAPAADLRRAVRAAVIAELGSEPAGLDAAIDKVLRERPT